MARTSKMGLIPSSSIGHLLYLNLSSLVSGSGASWGVSKGDSALLTSYSNLVCTAPLRLKIKENASNLVKSLWNQGDISPKNRKSSRQISLYNAAGYCSPKISPKTWIHSENIHIGRNLRKCHHSLPTSKLCTWNHQILQKGSTVTKAKTKDKTYRFQFWGHFQSEQSTLQDTG